MNVPKAQLVIFVALTTTLCELSWASEDLLSIEVFTDSKFQAIDTTENTTLYLIDSIDRLQQELSKNLFCNPEAAKQEVIRRFQGMDANRSRELENAAKGLVQALQYGIDRYPAIVFNGEAVVYGVSDIKAAARLYRQWQVGETQK